MTTSPSKLRLPPGQKLADKFTVLTYGPTPKIDLKEWRFTVLGEVQKEKELTWEQFTSLPKTTVVADFHCVTLWSVLDNVWEGVSFKEMVKLARPKPEARFVMVHAYGGYHTNLPLSTLMDDDVLFAYRHNGKPLEPDHGYPLRLIVPKRYAWKQPKWVSGLQFMVEDTPGFYERRGYNMRGDPWREERFWPELPADLAITIALCGTSQKQPEDNDQPR